jgi:hypothetical protein
MVVGTTQTVERPAQVVQRMPLAVAEAVLVIPSIPALLAVQALSERVVLAVVRADLDGAAPVVVQAAMP